MPAACWRAWAAALITARPTLSSENIPLERRGLATAVINSGSALGMAIGLIASSLLVKSFNMNWQIMLFIITGLLVVMTLVFAVVIKARSLKHRRPSARPLRRRLPSPKRTARPAACSACA